MGCGGNERSEIEGL